MVTQEILQTLSDAGLTQQQFKSAIQQFGRCNPKIHDAEFLAASVAGNIEDHERSTIVFNGLKTLLENYSRPDYIMKDYNTLVSAYPA
jgi:hypothetical protein